MSIDEFLGRMPGPEYNCFDFVREVWLKMKHEDIAEHKLKRLAGPFRNRKWTVSGMKMFQELTNPVDPCFVVMQRPRAQPHVGIWTDGRVLHLKQSGVEFQPLDVAKWYFTDIRFYV
jgi:hypothetical protein